MAHSPFFMSLEEVIQKHVSQRLDGQNKKLDEILLQLGEIKVKLMQLEQTKPVSLPKQARPAYYNAATKRYGKAQYKMNEEVVLKHIPIIAWVNHKEEGKFSRITTVMGGINKPLTNVFTKEDVFQVIGEFPRTWMRKQRSPEAANNRPEGLVVRRMSDKVRFQLLESDLKRKENGQESKASA